MGTKNNDNTTESGATQNPSSSGQATEKVGNTNAASPNAANADGTNANANTTGVANSQAVQNETMNKTVNDPKGDSANKVYPAKVQLTADFSYTMEHFNGTSQLITLRQGQTITEPDVIKELVDRDASFQDMP